MINIKWVESLDHDQYFSGLTPRYAHSSVCTSRDQAQIGHMQDLTPCAIALAINIFYHKLFCSVISR